MDIPAMRFAFPVWHESQIAQGALLARSIAALGGDTAGTPVRAYVAEGLDEDCSPLAEEGCGLSRFAIDPSIASLPFAAKCAGAARAETDAAADGLAVLVWMDPDSLILAEPAELRLEAGMDLAVRPVDHANIGSRADSPPDGFWSAIFSSRGVDPEMAWRVRGTVDGTELRAYLNAGLVAVRPGIGLLRGWRESLLRVVGIQEMPRMLEADQRRAIFLHQAVLSCEMVARVPWPCVMILPASYNFPIHMRKGHPLLRSTSPPPIATCRYGDDESGVVWMRDVPLTDAARLWLSENFAPD